MTPFDTTPRKSITPQQRAKFFASRHGICANCKITIRSGMVWHRDHIISLENGGEDTDENCQLLCDNCHVYIKTPEDRKEAATNRRKYTKHVIPARYQPPKRKLQSRGFTGSRKFNGDVVIYRED